MNCTKAICLFFLFLGLGSPSFAFQTLLINEKYVYEVFEPNDDIPCQVLDEGFTMYFEAYQFPRVHAGIALAEMQIDETQFLSYEEFMYDMFQRDFASYTLPQNRSRYYFQVRSLRENAIVAICVVLDMEQPGFYYINHIGVNKNFRYQGIANTLLKNVINTFPNFEEISLDTRVFNTPAQALYEKVGFKRVDMHPNPCKQRTYFHYILTSRNK